LDGLKYYDEIILTGGEPMQFPIQTYYLVKQIRETYPDKKIWLYVAKYDDILVKIMPLIDGLTYSLHATNPDIVDTKWGFNKIQDIIKDEMSTWYLGTGNYDTIRSYRLFIHNDIDFEIPLQPTLWKKIIVMGDLNKDTCKCPLENGERLYVWLSDFVDSDSTFVIENIIK
jgi:hypothetical protein